MSESARKKKLKLDASVAPADTPTKSMLWLVAITCLAVMVVLMRLARDILAQIQALGGSGGAGSLRLLTGLFVVMCLAGFVAAGLWKVGGVLLGRERSDR